MTNDERWNLECDLEHARKRLAWAERHGDEHRAATARRAIETLTRELFEAEVN